MTNRTSKTLVAFALAAVAALGLPAAEAGAGRGQVTMIQQDADLLGGPELRGSRLDEFRTLGVDIVKFRLDWRTLAPEGNTKPGGFSGEDPAEYPSDRWAPYDETVKGIVARGMRPFIMLGGRAPEWATNGSGFVTRPDGAEFKRFVQAVGTRYSGTYGAEGYGNPLGGTAPGALPRVSLWSWWNEPNLKSWLAPQYKGSTPTSPGIYRNLVYGGHDGLVASGHGDDEMLLGELQPFTGANDNRSKVRPIAFLRELACVDRRYKPYRGSAAKARGCTDFRPLPGTGLAYHPYTLAAGPSTRQSNSDDASIGQLSRVVSALDKLAKAKRIQRSKMPLWITEFGFRTNPPDRFQSPIKRVPGFMGESEWMAYRNKRVASYSQYLVQDAPGFNSGLRFSNGNAKPGVYTAFERPFFVRLRSSSQVEIFGGVRAGAAGQQVTVEQRLGSRGSFKALPGGTVALGPGGYFLSKFTISRAKDRQFRFRTEAGSSRTASPSRR